MVLHPYPQWLPSVFWSLIQGMEANPVSGFSSFANILLAWFLLTHCHQNCSESIFLDFCHHRHIDQQWQPHTCPWNPMSRWKLQLLDSIVPVHSCHPEFDWSILVTESCYSRYYVAGHLHIRFFDIRSVFRRASSLGWPFSSISFSSNRCSLSESKISVIYIRSVFPGSSYFSICRQACSAFFLHPLLSLIIIACTHISFINYYLHWLIFAEILCNHSLPVNTCLVCFLIFSEHISFQFRIGFFRKYNHKFS